MPRQTHYVNTLATQISTLSQAHKSTHHGFRNYLILLPLLDCGPRLNELIGLQLSDLSLAQRSLSLARAGGSVVIGHRLIPARSVCSPRYCRSAKRISAETLRSFSRARLLNSSIQPTGNRTAVVTLFDI